MEWFEIRVLTELPIPLKEVVTHQWFELGALGVDESEIIKGKPRFSAYFEIGNKEKVIQDWVIFLSSLDSPRKIEWQSVPVLQENWAEKYREFYRAQKLSHSFFLKPAWDEITAAPSDLITIRMDPGQAFGTGLHATTRLTLQLFERALGYYLDASQLSLLDVGTGTGILAIAAAKLGVGKITAVDIDEIAVETAAENFEINQVKGVALSGTPIQNIKEKFDIILGEHSFRDPFGID